MKTREYICFINNQGQFLHDIDETKHTIWTGDEKKMAILDKNSEVGNMMINSVKEILSKKGVKYEMKKVSISVIF